MNLKAIKHNNLLYFWNNYQINIKQNLLLYLWIIFKYIKKKNRCKHMKDLILHRFLIYLIALTLMELKVTFLWLRANIKTFIDAFNE